MGVQTWLSDWAWKLKKNYGFCVVCRFCMFWISPCWQEMFPLCVPIKADRLHETTRIPLQLKLDLDRIKCQFIGKMCLGAPGKPRRTPRWVGRLSFGWVLGEVVLSSLCLLLLCSVRWGRNVGRRNLHRSITSTDVGAAFQSVLDLEFWRAAMCRVHQMILFVFSPKQVLYAQDLRELRACKVEEARAEWRGKANEAKNGDHHVFSTLFFPK